MVEERHTNGFALAEATPVPQVEEPKSLAESLSGFKLTVDEQGLVLAINALPISTDDQRLYFAADLFSQGRFVRAGQLGFDNDALVAGRDKVVADPEGLANRARLKFLIENPSFILVANLKKYKFTHAEIAREMHKWGVNRTQVDKMSLKLVDLGILSGKKEPSRRFEEFRRRVEEADKKAAESHLSPRILAAQLATSPGRILRARRRNRLQVKASTLGRDGVAERILMVRSAITASPGKRNDEILENLRAAGYQGLTIGVVKHARVALIREGKVQGKRSFKGLRVEGSPVPTKADEAEAFLRILLANSEEINLSQAWRDNPQLAKVAYTTLIFICRRIARERKDQGLPPLPPFKRELQRQAKRVPSLEV